MKPSEIIADANRNVYENDYENIVMRGGKLNRWVYRKTHQELERFGAKESTERISILELGAQSDQHRPWVKVNYHSYVVSDIVLEPLLKSKLIYEDNLSRICSKVEANVPVVKFEKVDAEEIGYPNDTFNRIVATCLLVHLDNAIDALHEWRRVTKNYGKIDFYVPCEPGLILRMARNLTHKRKKLSVDFPYDLLHYSQHRNHYLALNEFINYIFQNDKIVRRFFPFRFLPWGFNLWAIYSIEVNKTGSK